MKTKFWIHLTTGCGCTRIVEWTKNVFPPMHYYVALPRKYRPLEQIDAFHDVVFDHTCRRTFELYGKKEIKENEFMLMYKEIVAG